MSLISDALKTAQRERSGQAATGSADQPLLEGFFPYVSTSAPTGRSRRTRIAMISVWALVALIVVMWFGVPMLRRAASGRPGKVPPAVLSQGQPAIVPVTPPVQVASPVDTQVAAAAVPEPAPMAARDAGAVRRSALVTSERPPESRAKSVV